MRNLKRALSLALASVMLLGMMVVGASAASYPDVSGEDNVEAIEVLNAVNVMIGDRGNFRPDAAVNRHEMAVIMAKLYLGSDEADNYVGTHPFTDVYPWADKYVAACYENGLVSGTSATTFSGNQPLTAIQAAAMMLRALGYENLSKGASDWRTPVAAKANQIRLFSGVVSSPNVQLTRNDVAQLALNTLEADVVIADVEQDIIVEGVVTIPGKTTYSKVEVKSSAPQYDGEDDGVQQLCEKLYGNDLQLVPTQEDNYGRPGLGWTYKTNDIIALRADTPIVTYTAHEKAADVKKDLKSYDDPDSSINVAVDGADGDSVSDIDGIATAIDTASGKGVTVTVYANDAKEITHVVVINTYFGKVTKVAEKDDETTVTVSKLAGGSSTEKTFETEAFEKDDYVLYTVGSEGIETMTAAKSLDGEITATSGSSYLRLDGTKYEYNKNAAAEAGALASVELGDASIYLDADGYVIYVGEVEAAAKQYFYVKGADLYMNEVSVKAVFADGTTEVVTISGDTYVKATVDNDDPNNPTIDGEVAFNSKKDDGEGFDTKLSAADYDEVRDEIAKKMIGKVFSYSESDKEYKVSDLGDAGDVIDDTNLEKGNNAIDTGVTANNNTVYVMTSNGKTYTGYRNVPSMDSAKLVYIEDEDNAGIATLVFVVSGDELDDENAFYFYVADETDYEKAGTNDKAIYTLNAAYVDGEETVVKVNKDVMDIIDEAGLYKALKANDDEVVTDAEQTEALDDMKADQADYADKGSILIDDTNYTYDSKTLFVYVDGDKVSVGEASDIIKYDAGAEEGDEITYVYIAEVDSDDSYYAKVVYIILDEQGAPPCEHNGTFTSVNDSKHKCDLCQAELDHNYGEATEVVGDDDNHKYTCEDCSHEKTEAHTYGDAESVDTTNHKFTCEGCSHEKTAAHQAKGEWVTTDATNHWHECTATGCDAELDKAAHDAAPNDGSATDNSGGTGAATTHTWTCSCGKEITATCTGDSSTACPACGHNTDA